MKNSKVLNEIKNRVLLKNFFLDNKMLIKFRHLNKKELCNLLKSRNLQKEARIFRKEGVDGMGFIVLCTDEKGEWIMKSEMNLSSRRINRLKEFYNHIFHFRINFCKDFNEDEFPFQEEYYN